MTDTAGMLSETCKADLMRRLKDLEQRNGTQLALLIVPSTAPQTIEQFAAAVFEKWKLGQKRVDNGMLLVTAVKDHRVRIEVGYGLEGAVPDVVAGQIIRDRIVPAFRQGAFEAGLSDAIDSLAQRLAPSSPDTPVSSDSSATDVTPGVSDVRTSSLSSAGGPAPAKQERSAGLVFWTLLAFSGLFFGAISEWLKFRWAVRIASSYLGPSAVLLVALAKGAFGTNSITNALLIIPLAPTVAGVVPCLLGIGWFRLARNWMQGTGSSPSSSRPRHPNGSTGAATSGIIGTGVTSGSNSSSISSSSDSSIIDLFIGGGGSSGGGGASDSW
ncbi:hypothetical protein WK73_25605 [Burkholderia ubonensis]|uniref:TPM domain-containing protein n=1 Tax=Burkholderia ubonensis TaxID=101571 RepID=UPI00076D9F55|nr:TPM domain-containing protein [Burkholderia ubonensis]KVU67584.1 hypothetical protein WK73_25605 [Burkholderia ubonensis]OJA34549.1 hypothetical protein BGX87_09200 [Burkholderia ubonensis]